MQCVKANSLPLCRHFCEKIPHIRFSARTLIDDILSIKVVALKNLLCGIFSILETTLSHFSDKRLPKPAVLSRKYKLYNALNQRGNCFQAAGIGSMTARKRQYKAMDDHKKAILKYKKAILEYEKATQDPKMTHNIIKGPKRHIKMKRLFCLTLNSRL